MSKQGTLFATQGSQIALIVASLAVILIAMGLHTVIVVYNVKLANDLRFCFGNDVKMAGQVRFKSSHLTWHIRHANLSSSVTALRIWGPVLPGNTSASSIALTLCGAGGSCLACATVGNVLEGSADAKCDTSTALEPVIAAIRAAPADYYLRVDTGLAVNGEVSEFMIHQCGWPV
jgi:hypothetical protein